jgi:mono/diheme cytochrome c family protein
MKNVVIGIVIVIVLGIGSALTYLFTAYPDVGAAPDISVEGTEQQIKRGKYLANHVSVCMDCHSTRNFDKFSGPIVPGTFGKGGDAFTEDMGLPGTFYSKNITPHNLGNWSDGEIYRAITEGVTKEGNALFPIMPYPGYSRMDPDDVKAIIAYLRTLEPIDYQPPESQANFPVSILLRTDPQPADPMERPNPKNTIKYGKYMITIAGCTDCHTPQNQGTDIKGMYLAGGFEYKMPFGTVRSANITPDNETGIGRWSQEMFVKEFKQYDVPIDSLQDIKKGDMNTLMPWQMYAGMSEQDLKAIYNYLRTVDAVTHKVDMFTPPSEEKSTD